MEKTPFLAFPEAIKANWRSQLHAQSSQMHSIPLGPSEKIPFVQKYKESAICAILREETPFWGIPRGKKGVVICAICLRKAAHWPNNNANPSGLSEKKVYCVESLQFCREGGNFSFERGGVGPSKKCWFWCNGPSTKAPQIPLRHQKTFHLALFLPNLAILKSAALFQGLN